MNASVHRCPGPCQSTIVHNTVLICAPCWEMLSIETRLLIWATVKLPTLHLDRRTALTAALSEWKSRGPGREL